MKSVNVSQDGQEVSPDRVFDFEAASCTTPSPEQALQLQQLHKKLEAELQQVKPPPVPSSAVFAHGRMDSCGGK